VAKKKYLAVPATLVAVAGVASFLQGRDWLSLQTFWITFCATALVLSGLLVSDLVGFFERRFLSERDRE
jgi:hypothetical protein